MSMNESSVTPLLSQFRVKRQKILKFYEYLFDGHNPYSASLKAGLSTKEAYKIAKKPYVQKKLAVIKQALNGEMQQALFKRGKGYNATETQEKLSEHGEIIELTSNKHIPSDTKATVTWLSMQDEEWKDANKTQTNQVLVNVSTNDLLLTLQSASSQIGIVDRGGGGVSPVIDGGVAGSLTSNKSYTSNSLPSSNTYSHTTGFNPGSEELLTLPDSSLDHADVMASKMSPDSKYAVIAEAKEAMERGSEMSDEEYLREMVQAEDEEC